METMGIVKRGLKITAAVCAGITASFIAVNTIPTVKESVEDSVFNTTEKLVGHKVLVRKGLGKSWVNSKTLKKGGK